MVMFCAGKSSFSVAKVMMVSMAHGNENNCTNGSQLRGRPFEGKNVVVIQYLLALNTALLTARQATIRQNKKEG